MNRQRLKCMKTSIPVRERCCTAFVVLAASWFLLCKTFVCATLFLTQQQINSRYNQNSASFNCLSVLCTTLLYYQCRQTTMKKKTEARRSKLSLSMRSLSLGRLVVLMHSLCDFLKKSDTMFLYCNKCCTSASFFPRWSLNLLLA